MSDSSSKPDWGTQSQMFCSAWLEAFATAVAALHIPGITNLFQPCAEQVGSRGYGPCRRAEAKEFTYDSEKTRILPMDPVYAFMVTPWKSGERASGFATFVICITQPVYDENKVLKKKGSVLCVHAHYSRKESKSMIIKAKSFPSHISRN